MFKMVVLAVALTVSPGCMAAAVGYGAYKIAESKKEVAHTQAEAKNWESYMKYRSEMEKNNTEREKSHLKPQPILDFAEWKVMKY